MLSATVEKNLVLTNDFVSEEKRKLLKTLSDIVVLVEISKCGGLSAPYIITLFEKYGIQMSPGTIYPLLYRMGKKKQIRLLLNRRKKLYVLADSGQKVLRELQLVQREIIDFINCLLNK